MTRLVNSKDTFVAEALEGYCAAYPGLVRSVPGGVLRAVPGAPGEVALVVGGGSGHFPAFAGWVGAGFAHAAVCGNIFASPSASQVYAVCRAADTGGGLLLGFGNYAGDMMQFGQAAARLESEGIATRIVTTTDDVASAPAAETAKRRGVAGDLLVFKVSGAAAAAGYDLDAVETVTRKANDRTRSLGVAFSGCTLPGSAHPLFSVEDGQMALGLGIHGEPGLAVRPCATADEIADTLVNSIFDDYAATGSPLYGGSRAAVLVNSLGGMGHEQLFVLFRRVRSLFAAIGVDIVAPEVGPHVTSLDMAGVSLTVMALDDELEQLWLAPAWAPSFRRGLSAATHEEPAVRTRSEAPGDLTVGSPGPTAFVADGQREAVSAQSAHTASVFLVMLSASAKALEENAEDLGRLDAVAGDGDHGEAMTRGASAALDTAQSLVHGGAGIETALRSGGLAWSDAAGGSSGALWCAAMGQAADALEGLQSYTCADFVRATRAAVERMAGLGASQRGDKTLLDAAYPFVEELEAALERGEGPARALTAASRVARQAAQATATMTARVGRARAHGAASLGTADPGAVSLAIAVSAAGAALGSLAEVAL